LEFRGGGFCGRRKTGEPTENPLKQGENLNNKLNPVIMPGPHWWEARSLTTKPSLLSKAEIHSRVTIFITIAINIAK